MKFLAIEEKEHGRFIHRYDIHYSADDGSEYAYEMISRNPQMKTEDQLKNPRTDAVVMIITDRTGEHMLIEREFRMDLGREIYGFPGGLIEPGESAEECARRELKEETGLNLVEVRLVMPPAYCSVGLSNELTVCLFGVAEGEISENCETGEEIHAGWYSKEDVLQMHQENRFGSWCLAFSWIWANGRFPL